ncbi:Lipocalin-like domain-containing protein [Ekhidna lutea]|uniref:Lipocalin-like domain-containing protein n=1 Tax=Ekhidna lutea TaxID=447679 RepID=A0A239I0A8_EKHLU|nr:lipocalin-like domain-containing protein [Ekhidna lutea]SNS86832.1 Lipocalin-like domain-containing protein [Ekhidna lutea]
MKKGVILVLSFMIFAACQPEKQQDVLDIAGVWKLVELSNYDEEGKVSQPYGNPPLGYFIYTPGGHMSIQIMKNPPHPRLTERPSDSIVAQIARGSITYFGTYSVDKERSVVIHEVEGALNPNYVNTDRERQYSISGDSLIINIESEGSRYKRVLLKVE